MENYLGWYWSLFGTGFMIGIVMAIGAFTFGFVASELFFIIRHRWRLLIRYNVDGKPESTGREGAELALYYYDPVTEEWHYKCPYLKASRLDKLRASWRA